MDVWAEIDTSNVELFEFIRSQINYTERELLEKPLHIFFDIVARAKKRAEQSAKLANKTPQATGG